MDKNLDVAGVMNVDGTTQLKGLVYLGDDSAAAKVRVDGAGVLHATGDFRTSGGFMNVSDTEIHTNNFQLNVTGSTIALGNNTIQLEDGKEIVINKNIHMPTHDISCRNIDVAGTMTTVHSQEVNIGDSHLHLNAFSSAATDNGSGIVSTCKKVTGTNSRTASVSGTTVTFTDSNIWDPGYYTKNAIVQLYDTAHLGNPINGLYQVSGSHDAATLNILTTGQLKFCKNSFDADSTDSSTISVSLVEVSHLYFAESGVQAGQGGEGGHGCVKFGHGHDSDIHYADLTIGDVKHSYEHYVDAAVHCDIKAHVTNISASNGALLPTSPVGGEVYKIINSSAVALVVTGTIEDGDGGTAEPTFTIQPHSMSTFYAGEGRYYTSV